MLPFYICNLPRARTMADLTFAFLALVPLLSWYFYEQLKKWRYQKYGHVPTFSPNNFALGHLKDIAEGFKKLGDNRRHVGRRSPYPSKPSELMLNKRRLRL